MARLPIDLKENPQRDKTVIMANVLLRNVTVSELSIVSNSNLTLKQLQCNKMTFIQDDEIHI